ncbi:MAG: hypothetical protein RSB66_05995, partial [Clostridium sp.]
IEYYTSKKARETLVESIKEEDFVVIVEATYYGMGVGMVTTMDIVRYIEYLDYSDIGESVIGSILRAKSYINGMVIGIDIPSIENLEPSSKLSERVDEITQEVKGIIIKELQKHLNKNGTQKVEYAYPI